MEGIVRKSMMQMPEIDIRSMTEFGRIRDFVRRSGLTLNDEAIEKNYLVLSRVLEAYETCEQCHGRESCPMNGLVPKLELGPGNYIYEVYGYCPKDAPYKKAKRIERLMRSSRLPEHFRTKMFETFEITTENFAAYKAAKEVAENPEGKGIVLAGPTGTGKTHLAAAILNYRIQNGYEAIFCTVPELLADIRRVIRNGQETSELMELVKTAELLILDDLGAERTTEWVTEQLFVVINARLLGRRQTVVTTNYTSNAALIEKLGGLAGQRIVSRLCEMCNWVKLDGPDWRLR